MLHRLSILDVFWTRIYFQSFGLAQFHGLELLPPTVTDHIDLVRSLFLRQLYRLPKGVPTDFFYVIIPSFTPTILCLQRRL